MATPPRQLSSDPNWGRQIISQSRLHSFLQLVINGILRLPISDHLETPRLQANQGDFDLFQNIFRSAIAA
jgi:hypothetical protein